MPLTFYVCPANITGLGSWASSLSRAQAMVSNMTLDEKVSSTPHLAYLRTYLRLLLYTDQLDGGLDE